MTDEQTQKIDSLINQIMKKAATLEKNEIEIFMVHLNLISAAILRGMNGDKYMNDFLTEALNDKNPMKIQIASAN